MNRWLFVILGVLMNGQLPAADAPAMPVEILVGSERSAQRAPLDADGYNTWLVRFREELIPKCINFLGITVVERDGGAAGHRQCGRRRIVGFFNTDVFKNE